MSKKKTTEEFIAESQVRHGQRYGYSKTVYLGATKPVIITCFDHGDWSTIPATHTRGSGCPECGKLLAHSKTRKSEKDALREIKQSHGDKYSYKIPLNYKNKDSKIEIFCNKHGWFQQSFHNHVQNRAGCRACGYESNSDTFKNSKEDFIRLAEEEHGLFYDYSEVDYVNSFIKVKIRCPDHAYFWQMPAQHVYGRGCPGCATVGFDETKPGYVYIFKVDNLTKIGISNYEPSLRAAKVSRSCGKQFDVATQFYLEDGRIVRSTETLLLQEYRKGHIQPPVKFDGYTECFYDVDLPQLVNKIETIIASQTPQP